MSGRPGREKLSCDSFHDSTGKKTTVQALPDVIADLQADGYAFAALSPESAPVRFANIPG